MNEKQEQLPTHIGGYQHIELDEALVRSDDILVRGGQPLSFCRYYTGYTVTSVELETGYNVYRKIPVPSARDDKECVKPLPNSINDAFAEMAHVKYGAKPTNPKDLIGSDKLPLHLWPTTATIYGALGLLDGALKYGRSNWRDVGVRASIYHDAAKRHLDAWFEGEDNDPDSELSHLCHLIACVAILIDAKEAGKLNDDRMLAAKYRDTVKSLTPHVKRLKEKYKDHKPKHFTIEDNK